jgi:GTP-binding protein
MGSLDGRDPYQDYLTINKELESYDMELLERPQIIVANKMDLPESEENLKRFKELVKEEVIPISAATKENISTLLYKIADTLDEVRAQEPKLKINEQPVEYTYQEPEADFTITRDEDGVFNVTGPTIKKLFDRTDFNFEENAKLFARRIRNLGVDAKLRELGVKTGDIVRIFDYEFEFIE